MMTLIDIQSLILENDEAKLNEYYKSGCDNLKELNKRSNQISLFLLLLIGFCFFSSSIKDISIMGFSINGIVAITTVTPVLISYFLLEWCLIAARRRDLMVILKQVGFILFNIKPTVNDLEALTFNSHSINMLPFSLFIELFSISQKKIIGRVMFLLILMAIFIIFSSLIVYTVWLSFHLNGINYVTVICNSVAAFFSMYIGYFYYNDAVAVRRREATDSLIILNDELSKNYLSMFNKKELLPLDE